MPNTVPNQRLIEIHRERATSDFLGIKNAHWQAAARDLGAHALMLYLYRAKKAAEGKPAAVVRSHIAKKLVRIIYSLLTHSTAFSDQLSA